jgi:hypothetical protein
MLNKIKPIAKAVVSIGGAVVITATVIASGDFGIANVTTVVVAWLTVLGVYHVANSQAAL